MFFGSIPRYKKIALNILQQNYQASRFRYDLYQSDDKWDALLFFTREIYVRRT